MRFLRAIAELILGLLMLALLLWATPALPQAASFCMNGPGRKCNVGTLTVGTENVTTENVTTLYTDAGTFNVINARLFDGGTARLDSAIVSGTVSAVTLDGGSIRGTTGNFSGPVVVSDTLSAQTLDGGSIRGTTLNMTGAAVIQGSVSSQSFDGGAFAGATLNLSGAIKADTLTLATKAPTGAWAVHWDGVVAESVNGEGGYYSDNVPPGYFEYVVCSCRVAGSGGTNGIFVELFEGGIAADDVELSGGDANACDDAAGTQLRGQLHFAPTNADYMLQFKNTTDCAVNPTDCTCNVIIER